MKRREFGQATEDGGWLVFKETTKDDDGNLVHSCGYLLSVVQVSGYGLVSLEPSGASIDVPFCPHCEYTQYHNRMVDYTPPKMRHAKLWWMLQQTLFVVFLGGLAGLGWVIWRIVSG